MNFGIAPFSPLLHGTPFIVASDIGHDSAYICKLPELPLGTSKGLLHCVQRQKIRVRVKMELRVISFRQGSPENFLSGVQTALEKIGQKGLLAANEQACKEDKEAEKKLVNATEAYISYQGVDESFPVKKH
jgi:hypothetical protein